MEKQLIFTPATFYVEAPFYLVAGDARAYTLVFHAGESVDGTMLLSATRADGETVTDSTEFSGRVCRYTMCNAMYETEGLLTVRVTVYTGEKVLTSNELSFTVLPAANAGTVEKEDRYPILTKLILKTREIATDAQTALQEITNAKNKLLPVSSEADAGKILYLRKKENVKLQYFTAELETKSDCVLEAGLADEDTAFLEIDKSVFAEAGPSDPTSDDCVFGLTFIPSSIDASTDYDVVAEAVTTTDSGYIFSFPLSSCPLMESVTERNLFDVFESVL